MTKHIIQIHKVDGELEIIKGLPKNWKIVIRDYDVDSENRLAQYDDQEDAHYTEAVYGTYCGEYVAPKLLVKEARDCHDIVDKQIKSWGRYKFKSLRCALEKCFGY